MNTPMSTPVPKMTVEEARAVRWLRNNPRTLGELLDMGYLNRSRLEWAARKAYDPQLRAAAAVLLEALDSAPARPAATEAPAVNAGITLEQARATRWPFQPYRNQPMGALVDAQQIGPQDLAYAIEHAWDERVRRAAIALMAVSLNQVVQEPPPAAGPLRVISGGQSYAEWQQLRLRLLQGFIAGLVMGLMGAALLAIGIWLAVQGNRGTGSPPSPSLPELLATPGGVIALIIAVVILLALFVGVPLLFNLLLDWIMRQFDKQVALYRRGQVGEERAVEALRRSLDGNWTLFRSIMLPGQRNDIDLVLVGPPGVWALEVKNLAGRFRNVGERWEFQAGRRWKPLRQNPSLQAQRNARQLANFLRADGLKQWVETAVVWANPESPLEVENPIVAVWPLDRLAEEVGNLWQGRTIAEPDRRRIIEKLERLCQKQKEEEAS